MRSLALRLREDQPRGWAEGCSRVGLVLAGAIGVVLMLGIVAFAYLVPWLLFTSLASFLAGPDRAVVREPVALALLSLPPVAASSAALVWVARRVRAPGRPRPSRAASGARMGHAAIGPRLALVLLAAGCCGYLAFARLVFLYARIQGAVDEGLYLYAARLAMSGRLPYRDFYFDQAPLLPYAFGLALGPFNYDEVAARLFAIGCTLLTLLVTFAAATGLGGWVAGLVAFALLATSVDFTAELSGGVQSNGPLTALCVALVALALACRRLGAALVLAAMTAGLRQLFLPLPLVLACYAAFGRRRPWLGLLAGVLPAVAVYALFTVIGGPAAPLALVRPLRQPDVVRMTVPPDIISVLDQLGVTLQRVLGTYAVFVLAAGPVACVALRRGHPRAPVLLALGASSILLLLANLTAYPSEPRYPVTQLPLAAVLGGVGLAALVERARADTRLALLAGLGLLLVVSPLNAYRDANFVALFHDRPPLARFLAAAAYVRSVAPPGGTLLSLETPFATQAGLRLPRGLEAGSWGVYAHITPERARELGVVTYPMLVDMVEQGVGDVVISSDRYGFVDNFASSDDEKRRLQRALDARYELTETFGNVSDWGNVRVWVKRCPPPPPEPHGRGGAGPAGSPGPAPTFPDRCGS